jgi:hypothetical protein
MICPHCRDVAAFKDHRDKTFTTLVGDVRLGVRPYYHCSCCHRGHFPGDQALGLADRRMSVGVEQIIALGGSLTSFAEAATKILPKMSGIRFSESTVERLTETNGARLGQLWEQGQTLGPAQDWGWNRDASGQTVAYLSVDATGVPQQGPGGVKTECKMVYVGMVFNATEFDPESPQDGQPIEQARYLAGLIDLESLGAQLRRQAGQVGMDRAQQWIGLSDGGNGLDEFFKVHFPRATLILDFYHAAEHLDDLAKAWSDPTATAESLLDQWRHQMRHEGGAAVLRTLEALDRQGRSPEALEQHRLVTQYISKNAYRMDYPTYRAKGWQIGSGSIESGCKTVICKRLCDGGMRWGGDGTDSVSHLRALLRSEPSQWEAFWSQSRN